MYLYQYLRYIGKVSCPALIAESDAPLNLGWNASQIDSQQKFLNTLIRLVIKQRSTNSSNSTNLLVPRQSWAIQLHTVPWRPVWMVQGRPQTLPPQVCRQASCHRFSGNSPPSPSTSVSRRPNHQSASLHVQASLHTGWPEHTQHTNSTTRWDWRDVEIPVHILKEPSAVYKLKNIPLKQMIYWVEQSHNERINAAVYLSK